MAAAPAAWEGAVDLRYGVDSGDQGGSHSFSRANRVHGGAGRA
jgi:hypothetical protein